MMCATMLQHNAVSHPICLLWCLIYAAAHTCTWCASHAVSNTADASITHIGNLETALRAFEESPHIYLPNSLTCLAVP